MTPPLTASFDNCCAANGGTRFRGPSVQTRDTGTLVVTDRRVLLAGRTKGGWQFAKLLRVEHSVNVTWLLVSNRTRLRRAVRHRGNRVAIELVIADAPPGEAPELGAGRGTVVARIRQTIPTHDRDRPQPPPLPGHLQPTAMANPVG